MKPEKYYLGLDMGSTSVGYAVTDQHYNLVKANQKSLWGVRLFDEASTAAKRRLARSSRRRRDREVLRLKLLQDLFSHEINKVDPAFFQRLNDSFFLQKHKTDTSQRFSLFNDPDFTDIDYHRLYPTIYHLRSALMSDPQPHDVRLVYLACHHILKHRGHFLYEGSAGFEIGSSFQQCFAALQQSVNQALDLNLTAVAGEVIHDVFLDRKTKRADKERLIMTRIGWDEKLQKDFLKLLLGYSVNLANLFGEEYGTANPNKVTFDKGGFEDEKKEELSRILDEDDFALLETAYLFFGQLRLENLLRGHKTLSEAKIALYAKHKTDLSLLKSVLPPSQFGDFYNKSAKKVNNYVAYTGHLRVKGIKKSVNFRCSSADFFSEVKNQLKSIDKTSVTDGSVSKILEEIENGLFLPLQKSKDNSLIPNQLQQLELIAILNQAQSYLPFLKQLGAEGLTIREMIESLVSFRIPYFVGPLNPAHRFDRNHSTGSHHAWLTKRSSEPVRPWNFNRVVDETQSAMDFIANLTNKCSQLIGEDVLPKSSPTYSKFAILNLLNVITVNGERLQPAIKQKLYTDFFLNPQQRSKLTLKKLLQWFAANNLPDLKEGNIAGMDVEIPGDMRAELQIEAIAPHQLSWQEKDEIVRLLTTLPDAAKMICERLSAIFSQKLNSRQIESLARLKFRGWGRLSEKLLNGISDTDADGQKRTILETMWDFSLNLQEVLSSRRGFKEQIEAHNREMMGTDKTLSYRMVQDYPISPSVRRMCWQALKVVKELTGIIKQPPEKLFLEVAREEGKKERTTSRKKQLQELYKEAKEVDKALETELEGMDDSRLRRKKIFLYFMQLGKCAYSGEPIDLEQIDRRDASGFELYDIDHIYPRSTTKDDSLHNNLVLVKGILNREKGDTYPITPEVRNKQRGFWTVLKEKGLMNSEKFNRLVRGYPLTEDELAGFINRQLVETRQATKAAARLLQQALPDTRVVFVKAGHVSDFRYHQEGFKFVKVRGMNDLHHAKDAYLNIVVGNVFDSKFTANPRNFIRSNPPRSYNLAKMYDFAVPQAWQPGEEGTLSTVKRTMARNNILVTYQTRHNRSGQNGGLFDQKILRKGKGLLPIKTSDSRLSSAEGKAAYGAYNMPTGYTFFVVERLQEKKQIRTIVPLPLSFASTHSLSPDSLQAYCTETLGFVQPKILIKDLPYNSILRVNGFPLRLMAKSDTSIKFASALQPLFPVQFEPLIKQLLKVEEKDQAEDAPSFNRPTSAAMLDFFDFLANKLSDSPFDRLSAFRSLAQKVRAGRESFTALPPSEQQKALRQILVLFQADGRLSDLSLLLPKNERGEPSTKDRQVGMLTLAQDLSPAYPVELILQSPSGLFQQVTLLNDFKPLTTPELF